MTALGKQVLKKQAPTTEQERQAENNLLDGVLAEHKGHPSNYAYLGCRICLFNARYHIEREDKDSKRARQALQDVSVEELNAAINDVNAALGETLVKPIAVGEGVPA